MAGRQNKQLKIQGVSLKKKEPQSPSRHIFVSLDVKVVSIIISSRQKDKRGWGLSGVKNEFVINKLIKKDRRAFFFLHTSNHIITKAEQMKTPRSRHDVMARFFLHALKSTTTTHTCA